MAKFQLLPAIHLKELKKTTKNLRTNHVAVTFGAMYFLVNPYAQDKSSEICSNPFPSH
jgi:hypothetical protein